MAGGEEEQEVAGNSEDRSSLGKHGEGQGAAWWQLRKAREITTGNRAGLRPHTSPRATDLFCIESCVYWGSFHCTEHGLYKFWFVTPSQKSCGSPGTGFIPTYFLIPLLLKTSLLCVWYEATFFLSLLLPILLPSHPTSQIPQNFSKTLCPSLNSCKNQIP